MYTLRTVTAVAFLAVAHGFSLPSTTRQPGAMVSSNHRRHQAVQLEREPETTTEDNVDSTTPPNNSNKNPFWEIAPSLMNPGRRPLTDKLLLAMETKSHPDESQEELGRGISILSDWRENWQTYESPPDDPTLIDDSTGYAHYEIDDLEGDLPNDLVGVLYRNGPGKFGVGGERVQHTLDADAMVYKITFPPPDADGRRAVIFTSRFVQTEAFQQEQAAGRFLYRGTFGTGPTAPFLDAGRPKDGLNTGPVEPSVLARVFGSAMNVDIKNSANTQVISFGGKVLTLFEAGLPHALNPRTLETLGEDTLGGVLSKGLPVKLGGGIPEAFEPKMLGGSAHSAHPNICPKTGNLVGWHWSSLAVENCLQLTFTEWSNDGFQPIQSATFQLPGCDLAPHDMAITENCIVMNINAMTMNRLPFLSGLKGAAASLSMDGRAPVQTWVFPRPTSTNQFEPFSVETPACFTIHHSHGYEDPDTGHIVTFFTGWPPSDSKDFLGAWGGYAPEFQRIPATFLWKLEIDPKAQKCVSLAVAPGSTNACVEHVLVHPHFNTRKAEHVYGTVSNLVGDSTPPNGYAKLNVESGSTKPLQNGEFNNEIDAYWFGTRYFVTEPLIVPKHNGNIENEQEAYMLGVVKDAAAEKNFLAIFDLESDLSKGPICKVWLKSAVPHGIHGCFAQDEEGGPSIFC